MERRERFLFAALLALAVVIRLVLVFVLPHGQEVRFRIEGLNDEPSHFNYIRYLAEHRSLPVQTASARDPDAFQRNEYEYYQPPVYYLAGASLYRAFGAKAAFYASRFLSAFLGLAALALVSDILRRMGASPRVRAGAVLFAALFPAHAYFCAMVSNDALSWFIALFLTRQLVMYRNLLPPGGEARLRHTSLLIAALLAFGMLIKSSLALFYFPVIAMYAYIFRKTRRRAVIAWGAAVVAGSLLAASPWYLRNLDLYGSWSAIEVGNGPAQRELWEPQSFVKFLKDSSRYFWFPMQHIMPTDARRLMWGVGALLLAANLVLALRFIVRRPRIDPAIWFLLILFGANIAGFLEYNILWLNSEGRFLFPSLIMILLFFTVPLHDFLRERKRAHWLLPAMFLESSWPYANLLLQLRP